MTRASKDKSQIMVELMPMKGNTGRASTKVQSGRSKLETLSNNYNENFG